MALLRAWLVLNVVFLPLFLMMAICSNEVGLMPSQSASQLGFWSAVCAAISSVTFSVTGMLGLLNILSFPWDPAIPDGASLILAVAFLVMMVSIHHSAPITRNHWSLVGVVLAVLYTALVSIVYFVIVTVVVPYTLRGEADRVAPFMFDQSGSFMQALDGLGYFFMSLSTWFAAFVFVGPGLEKWLRRVFVLNGVLGIPILLAYMPLVIPQPYYQAFPVLGVLWIFSVPALTILTAVFFRQKRSMTA